MRIETTSMGLNRTGIATSPVDSAQMIKAAEEGCASAPPGGPEALASVRQSYQNDAEPSGTVPVPPARQRRRTRRRRRDAVASAGSGQDCGLIPQRSGEGWTRGREGVIQALK